MLVRMCLESSRVQNPVLKLTIEFNFCKKVIKLLKHDPTLSQGPLGALVGLAASWEPPGGLLGASGESPGSLLGASWEFEQLLGASWEFEHIYIYIYIYIYIHYACGVSSPHPHTSCSYYLR